MLVKDKIKMIKGKKYAGSSLRDGKMYHDLPFEGLNSFKSHRSKTRDRIEQIKRLVDVKRKSILDLGCSVGGISLGMIEAGASMVTGIDYDNESIEVARESAKELGYYDRMTFTKENINIEMVKTFSLSGGYDIIIWLSQWMWCVKQYGITESKQLLFEVSHHAPIMIFESAADDGMAKIRGATQADIKKWLYKNTVYRTIEEHDSVGGWQDRKLYVCTEPMINYSNRKVNTSSVLDRISPDKIKKRFVKPRKHLLHQEVKALKKLEKFEHFPKVLEVGEDYFVMTYAGHPIDRNAGEQVDEIMDALDKTGISHNDIRVENFLWNDRLMLIDFGKCTFEDEDKKFRIHQQKDKAEIKKIWTN